MERADSRRSEASNILQWRHNEPDCVSNHQPHDCLLNCLFRRTSKIISKLRVTALCAGNSPETGEFPAQMANNAENDSIWWRHHEITFRVASMQSTHAAGLSTQICVNEMFGGKPLSEPFTWPTFDQAIEVIHHWRILVKLTETKPQQREIRTHHAREMNRWRLRMD